MAWAIRLPVGIDLASFIGLRAFVVPSTGDGVVFQLLMTVAIKLSAVGCHQKIASGRFYYRNKDHIDTTSQNQATCMFMPFTRSSTSLCIPVSAGVTCPRGSLLRTCRGTASNRSISYSTRI
jgi:hypothetical protein